MDNAIRMASLYDLILGPFLAPVRRAVVATIRELPVTSIVDFCCGTGNQIKYLKEAGYHDILGVDLAPEMLAQARRGADPAPCSQQDATQTDLPSEKYDLGMVSLALHEKPRETAAAMLRELRRVVKPGGYLIVVDYCYDERTKRIGRLGTTLAERLAGGEHYRNFRSYLAQGGMDSLLLEGKLLKEEALLFGAVRLRLLQR